jgi:proline iminopeptidase
MRGGRDDTAGLYPPIEPYRQGWLNVGAPHRLYWEESGNPKGVPVLFLHGGPGAGCAPIYRRFFDPKHWRIVLFDQRGSGRSTPNAELIDNDTPHLVGDIEALRVHLGIESWLVFGGSWGSTLALAYGEAYAERCLGFVLRGVFLFRAVEVEWFLSGMGTFFPEPARVFRDFLPEAERADPLAAYYRRLIDPNPAVHLAAAQIWCGYEESCSRLISEGLDPRGAAASLAMSRIEAHYMVHKGFMAENQLLDNLHRLHGLPAIVVQGRYDMVCPIKSADDLVRAWPGAEFVIVPDGAHSALEPGIRNALVAATDRLRSVNAPAQVAT